MGENVIMIESNNVNTFMNGWNGMGNVNGKHVRINYEETINDVLANEELFVKEPVKV